MIFLTRVSSQSKVRYLLVRINSISSLIRSFSPLKEASSTKRICRLSLSSSISSAMLNHQTQSIYSLAWKGSLLYKMIGIFHFFYLLHNLTSLLYSSIQSYSTATSKIQQVKSEEILYLSIRSFLILKCSCLFISFSLNNCLSMAS